MSEPLATAGAEKAKSWRVKSWRAPQATPPRRLRVLVSAFACRPESASEAAVGWNVVRELSRHHDVVVLTATRNREAILRAQAGTDGTDARFVFLATTPLGDMGSLGFNADYHLWQLRAIGKARALLRVERFDVAHHVTYARYWVPSFLTFLPIPYVFGPVGGGESAPSAFVAGLSRRGRRFEMLRNAARSIGEADPMVRRTIRRSAVVLASTAETAVRMRRLGAKRVDVLAPIALSDETLDVLVSSRSRSDTTFRCASSGRLLHWKGFDVGLRAFASAGVPHAEYWILGDGKERGNLTGLAAELGIGDRVRFFGNLSRHESLERMAECNVLLHPSLHESAGFVCLEAMAAGMPVLCLDAGGPAHLAREGAGVAVGTGSREEAQEQLAQAIRRFASDGDAYRVSSRRASAFARSRTWRRLTQEYSEMYHQLASP